MATLRGFVLLVVGWLLGQEDQQGALSISKLLRFLEYLQCGLGLGLRTSRFG